MTSSSYYSGNVGKGGVFLQLFVWLGVEHLWVVTISDTYYQEHSGIFQKQKEYAKHDLIDERIILFHNIFDKGYLVSLMAWRQGGQPVFCKM